MTSEHVVVALVAICILILTAQTAYALGQDMARKRERALADRRVQGVLDYERNRRPKARKNKLKAARRRTTAPRLVGGVA